MNKLTKEFIENMTKTELAQSYKQIEHALNDIEEPKARALIKTTLYALELEINMRR